jgi:CheY-like chemotaxis protein
MSVRQGNEKLGEADDEGARRVLVVDDEESIRILLSEILSDQGYSVVMAADGLTAIDLLGSHSFDLIITDCNMPGVGGLEAVKAAKQIDPRCPIMVISGHPSSEADLRLIGHPRPMYMQKPFSVQLIQQTATKLIEG